MSVYKRGRIWWVRWRGPDGEHADQTTSTSNKDVAQGIERTLDQLRAAREWDVLRAVLDGRVTLGDLYDARLNLEPLKARLDDTDLRRLVGQWRGSLEVRRLASAARYHRQVLAYLTAHPTRSTFTRANLSAWLNRSLSVATPTRQRYKAALSVFGAWLVEQDVIAHNPLKDVRGFRANRPRTTHVDRADAKRLVLALASPYREMAALMVGTGMEQQAVLRLRRHMVDTKRRRVFADGGKSAWRQRQVRCTEAWAWPIFLPALDGRLPHALVFGRGSATGDATVGGSLDYHVRRVLALPAFQGLPTVRPHDFRHCYAVWSLRDGMNPRTVQHQLGHATLSMTINVYGVYIPDRDSDYAITAKASAI